MKGKITFKRINKGRYEVFVDGQYKDTIFNPHCEDQDYPNRWFIRDERDCEGYSTLKAAKEKFTGK